MTFHLWVPVSLGAPFMGPCATLKQNLCELFPFWSKKKLQHPKWMCVGFRNNAVSVVLSAGSSDNLFVTYSFLRQPPTLRKHYFGEFFTPMLADGLLQVSRTLLSTLNDLNNAVVWMASTRPLISNSSPLYQSFGVCTKSTNHKWYKRHFHVPQYVCFFQFPCKVEVFILLFAFFQFYSVVSRDSKVHNLASSLFFNDYFKVWSSGRD